MARRVYVATDSGQQRDQHPPCNLRILLARVMADYAQCLAEEIKRVSQVYDTVSAVFEETSGLRLKLADVDTGRNEHIEYTRELYAGCLANEIKDITGGWDAIIQAAKDLP